MVKSYKKYKKLIESKLPKYQILFYKNRPSHDFILRTLTLTFMLSFNIHLTSSSK